MRAAIYARFSSDLQNARYSARRSTPAINACSQSSLPQAASVKEAAETEIPAVTPSRGC